MRCLLTLMVAQSKMMGQKALASAEIFVEDLQLQGQLTPQEFLQQRDAALKVLFPTAEFMPGTPAALAAGWSMSTACGLGAHLIGTC